MKYKVSELEGALLDLAVAKALGLSPIPHQPPGYFYWRDGCGSIRSGHFEPSKDWSVGGPIIERERMMLVGGSGKDWWAELARHTEDLIIESEGCGSTPLVAAMRAYVDNRFGEEIDL